MDEYTIRIEANGVELWRGVFDFVPSRNCVYECLGAEWGRLHTDGQARFDISNCYAVMQRCNSIPGEFAWGKIYLDHVWKLVA